MSTDLELFGEDDFEKQLSDLASKSLVALTLDELTSLSSELLNYAQVLGKRTALMTYEAGRVLFEVRARLKVDGKWVSWQKKQGLARSTVGIVISLYERVQDAEKLRGLTIMDAYRKFGVGSAKKKLTKPMDASAEEKDEPQGKHGLVDHYLSWDDQGGDDVNDGLVVSPPTTQDDESINDSALRMAAQNPFDLGELKREIIKSVTQELGKSVPQKMFEELEVHRCSGEEVAKLLQIADEPTTLPDAVLAEALLRRPLGPDARLEQALDEVTSAATRARSAGLDGPGALWVELLDLIACSAKRRLQHV